MTARLIRKRRGRVVAGVCAGLADYVGISRSGLRFLVSLGIVATGLFPGLFVYLLCVVLIPGEEPGAPDDPAGADAAGGRGQRQGTQTGEQGQWNPSGGQGQWKPSGSQGQWDPNGGQGQWNPNGGQGQWNPNGGQGQWNPNGGSSGPWAETDPSEDRQPGDRGRGRLIGAVMIIGGAAILIRTFLPGIDMRILASGGLVVFGLLLLFRKGE